MAVKIRLKKMGAKKKPFFRVVAADTRSPRDGRFIELLGYYNPMTDPPDLRFDEDKVYKWLDAGAEPTESAAQLLKRAGLLERWQLLKEGVKISELDAKIAERREKQPKPIPTEVKEAAKKKKAEEKKAEAAEGDAAKAKEPEAEKAEAPAEAKEPEAEKAETPAEAKEPEAEKAETPAEAKEPEAEKVETPAETEEPKAETDEKPEEPEKAKEPEKAEEPAGDEKKE